MAKKKNDTGHETLHTIQKGQVVATVELRQSNAGFSYKQFTLTRKWQTRSSGKSSTSTGFFEQHEDEIVDAVRTACAFIRERPNGPTVSSSDSEEEPVMVTRSGNGTTTSEDSSDA